jgi:lipopolysaccharide transport system ATP-binding protein
MPGIVIQGAGKRYKRQTAIRPYTFQEAVLQGFRGLRSQETFWALHDVSLTVAAGEMVGVIGRNGAGKTSLLRLVGGIAVPDEGRVQVEGRLGALIDLGAGFHPELTGRENAVLNGVISGLRRSEAAAALAEIAAFAEMEAFLDSPVRTYSSGMLLRLAFSVAIHTRPEVLLVDEVLSVGDMAFQRKCQDRIHQLREAGTAVLFVTHDLAQAEQTCDRILWLDQGRVAACGNASEVVIAYRDAMQRLTRQIAPGNVPDQVAGSGNRLRMNENRFGSLQVTIGGVRLVDGTGRLAEHLPRHDSLTVEMEWQADGSEKEVIFGVGLHSADGQLLCELFTPASRLLEDHGTTRLHLHRLDISSGAYWIDVGVYPSDWAYIYDYHRRVYPLVVSGEGSSKGPLHPPHRWELGG